VFAGFDDTVEAFALAVAEGGGLELFLGVDDLVDDFNDVVRGATLGSEFGGA